MQAHRRPCVEVTLSARVSQVKRDRSRSEGENKICVFGLADPSGEGGTRATQGAGQTSFAPWMRSSRRPEHMGQCRRAQDFLSLPE